ncbi:MAG: exonuclease SbcCD subunit D, partial [bacterium]
LFSDVRSIFEDRLPPDCSVVMVPGNHDENLADLSWSPPYDVLSPYERYQIKANNHSVYIHGLPYLRGETVDDFVERCEFPDDGLHLMLGHASYISDRHRYLVDAIERHDEENAFLMYEEDVAGAPFDRVLLGHWHSYQEMGGDPKVTYVGSPLPNNRLDRGRKKLMIQEIEGSVLTFSRDPVPTPPGWYYEHVDQIVLPGYEDRLLDQLEEAFPEPDAGCELTVSIEGFVRENSEQLRREVDDWIENRDDDFRNIDLVTFDVTESEAFDTPLTNRLMESLEESNVDESLGVEEIITTDEPNLIFDRTQDLLEEQPDEIKHRAAMLLMNAVYREFQ